MSNQSHNTLTPNNPMSINQATSNTQPTSKLPRRDFITVARIVQNLVPREYDNFHTTLKSIISSATYTSPETMAYQWARMCESLNWISDDLVKTNKNLAAILFSIVSDKRLDEIKIPELS